MGNKNSVFIATSLDGYIADVDGGIEWLNTIPNPTQNDMGYEAFFSKIDALIMGRNTFETVCGFDMEWPYTKPVFVLSNTLNEIPQGYQDKVYLIKGDLEEVVNEVHQQGYSHLYIDGGATIQSFLKADLIDEMTITIIPVLLGGGVSLFSQLPNRLDFECVDTKIYLSKLVQNHFRRVRTE